MAIEALPLLSGDLARPLIRRAGECLNAKDVLARARALAERLPAAGNVINLCEDRGHFLTGFCAAVIAGKITLLPPSRAPDIVADIARAYSPAAVLNDAMVAEAASRAVDEVHDVPRIVSSRIVAIGFTSGSTGTPKANPKTWGVFAGSAQRNRGAFERCGEAWMNVLSTVPSQHMYGMETCVILPLLGDVAVAVDRPLFPRDLADALARVPEPCLLVTTPVHLRAFVEAGIEYPRPGLIVSATAPLSPELAAAAERVFRAPLLEVFGSTETCVIGARRTAVDPVWRLHPQLHLEKVEEGALVHAPYFESPVLLRDHVRMIGDDRFHVEGRCEDMVEIAGKRASLGDIAMRLQAVPGVLDAAVVQAAKSDAAGIRRIVAFVVAPTVDDDTLIAALRRSLDPVFLPRRLCRLEKLPRNETGKLQREALAMLLGGG